MSEERKLKVILSGGGTGGHIYPAVAVAEALGHFRTTEPKGEFVIVVAGKPKVRRVREDGEE